MRDCTNQVRRTPRGRIAAIRATSLAVFILLPAPLSAKEQTCRGGLGAVTVDQLRVPAGATCNLNRTRIKGNIKVESGGSLDARGARVSGNVQAEDARHVSITQSSRVGGSVQIRQGGSATVIDSIVRGNIHYSANSSLLRVNDNRVHGNVQIIGNRAQAHIYRNVIDGNLQCKENDARPVGGNDKVRGHKEGQCAGL